ncbi:MAG: response regulator [Acidobacteria bacterium]|nr:response regulator [Acidobacteriota bacterium]
MKRRILVVDDEAAARLTLKKVLEMNGFEVETAGSLAEALVKLNDGPYHMVISNLAGESETAGWEVMRAAQATDYNPAIALLSQSIQRNGTGRADQSVYVRPENASDLLRQIEALLIAHEDSKRGRPRKAPARVADAEDRNRRVRRAR